MANEENLRPYKKGELSGEEAKKRGSKGGKASVEARRRKKKLRELTQDLLASKASKLDPSEAQKIASQLGLSLEEVSLADLLVSSIAHKAIYEKDVSAFNAIRDTAEGKPMQAIDHKGIEKTPITIDLSGLKSEE